MFPGLDATEFEDCIVTFNRTGQFENYSVPHNVAKGGKAEGGSKNAVVHFGDEKLTMHATLYSSKGTYLSKRADVGVFLKKNGAERYTRAGKITLELNKFGSGKSLELNALFSHKSVDHNIDVHKATMKFALQALTRTQVADGEKEDGEGVVAGVLGLPQEEGEEEEGGGGGRQDKPGKGPMKGPASGMDVLCVDTDTEASDYSAEEPPMQALNKAMSVVNEGDEDLVGSSVYCYIFC